MSRDFLFSKRKEKNIVGIFVEFCLFHIIIERREINKRVVRMRLKWMSSE